MAWITSAQLGRIFDTAVVTALGLDDADTFADFELQARATVMSVTQYAGYGFGDTLTDDVVSTGFLRKLIGAVIIRDAWQGRKGINIGNVQTQIAQTLSLLDAIYDKKLAIPGAEPSSQNGYGGVKFNSNSTTRPKVFDFRGTNF